jgi:hypothetical protein
MANTLDQFAMLMSFYSLRFQIAPKIQMVLQILQRQFGLRSIVNLAGASTESSQKEQMELILME